MRGHEVGFTLIELMIVVVVIAILASIAYPSYTRYVQEARRADAKAGLFTAAQQLERCYTQNGTYAGCAYSAASPDKLYTVSRSSEANATTFTLKAEYTGQGDDGCSGALTISHLGAKDPESCW